MNETNNNIIPSVDKSMQTKTCVIYTRTATQTGLDAPNSLRAQESLCKKRAKKNGLVVLDVFEDECESWLSPFREGLNGMIECLMRKKKEKAPVDFVLVSDMSRVSRDILDWLIIAQDIESCGTKIRSIGCDIRMSNETLLYEGTNLLIKLYKKESVSKRIKAGMESKKRLNNQ